MTTSVTYTFSNATTADATQVNQNFTDVLSGLNGIDKLTSRGDLLTRNATVYSRLALGFSGKSIISDGTDCAWAWPAVLGTKSGDYTILDTDGYKIIYVTTGASTITITLPTVADNANREITIKKADSGAGKIIIDGEGAETIEGALTREIGNGAGNQYKWITLLSTGSAWVVTAICGDELVATGSATAMTTGQFADGGNSGLTLAPGTWDLQATVVITFAASSSWTFLYATIGTASGNSSAGTLDTRNSCAYGSAANVPTATPYSILVTPVYRVKITAATSYYPKNYSAHSVAAINGLNTLIAKLVG